MSKFRFFIWAILLCSVAPNLEAQILGSIMREAQRKLERKIEDKIVDAVTDEIARRAFRPVEQAIDSMMRQKYRDSINGGKEVDWDKAGAAYAQFLEDMNKAVDLPEKYTFDIIQEVETTDYKGRKNPMKLYYSKTLPVMGMENMDEEKSTQLVVMDIERDVMVLYSTDKKGKKKAQAIPSVMKFSGAMAASVKTNEADKDYEFKIVKTGKTKKIAGYTGHEYKGESKEDEMDIYVCEDLKTTWSSRTAAYMQSVAPASYIQGSRSIEGGLMLAFETTKKKGDKERTSWDTKKLTEKSFTITNADYQFGELKD